MTKDHLKVHGASVEQIYIDQRSFFGRRDGTFGYMVLSYAVAHGKRVLNSRYRFDHLADRSMEHCDLTKVEIPIYQVRAARISFGNWLMDTVDVLRDFEHSSPLPACLAVTSNELKIW